MAAPDTTASLNIAVACAEREAQELMQFVYLMPVAVARLGPGGAVEMLNPKAVQILEDLDIDSGRADGSAILDALQPGLAARWRASAGQIGPVVSPQRCTGTRPDGVALHLMLQLVRPDERCTMLAIEDVTAAVEQERELMRQRRRIGLVLEHIQGYCVAMLDSAGAVIDWNPSIGRLFGCAASDVVGLSLLNRVAVHAAWGEGAHAASSDFGALAASVAQQGWCRFQAPWHGHGGQMIWGDCVVTPVVEADGQTQGFVAVIRDITDEHLRTQKLIDAALTDVLTGVGNRRMLDEALAREVERARRQGQALSLLILDIDHFKRVNDTWGHETGDRVLRETGSTLMQMLRATDIATRMGGEEFVVLLPATALADALVCAERFRAALATHDFGLTAPVTSSFGVAALQPQETGSALLARADGALYLAKQQGRNRVVAAPPATAAVDGAASVKRAAA